MPEPLTDPQLQALHHTLQQLACSLEKSVQGADERSEIVDLDGSMGRLSRMDALQQQEMALAQSRQSATRLQAVRRALRRIDSDDYGWCPDCDEPIAVLRLQARPEAPFCVACTGKRGG